MSETVALNKGKVPFGQKVAFGLGMLANQMFPAALGIFMVVLVQDLGFPGWMWGLIYFLPRVFDSITDPIMGFISDNTRSKWGRRRQYVFLGAVIMGVAYVIMWQLYRENSLDYNFGYFMLWSFVFYLGLTIFSVPYVAMGYEMSDDFHERTSIMATAQWIGQWAWVIAPWFWVIMYDPDWFANADSATRTLAWWVGIPCMILAMIPAIFIPSKSTENDDSLEPLSLGNIGGSLKEIFKGFKEAFQIEEFRRLCVSTFFIFNAFNTVAAFSFFIVVYYLFGGDAEAAGIWPTLFGSVGALVTTFAVIPTVAWMSKKLGKKRAFVVSQAISIVGYVLLWFLFIPGKPYLFMIALPFFSFGIGSLFTLMMSMTADVIDLDELRTGKRREGIFGAIYWWMVKFGFAIAGGLSGVILSFVGFSPESYTEESITGLRLFFSGVPIAGTVIALIVMSRYELTENRANEVRAAIEKKKILPTGSSSYGVGKLQSMVKGATLDSAVGIDFTGKSNSAIRTMVETKLEENIHGLCFSPYIEGQDTGDILSKEQIRRRMEIIAPYTSWIRSFSSTKGNELIPRVAKEHDLKTMVGAWIGKDGSRNEEELEALAKLAHDGMVNIAAIGNEVLLRKELSVEEVLRYLSLAREKLPAGVPIGYVDTYYQFIERPELVDACDHVLINCYPFWEGADIDYARTYLAKAWEMVKKNAKGKKVIVTETGWPSQGEAVQDAVASEANAMRYFLDAQDWAAETGVDLFYFSSFDESWKVLQEGEVGTRWGLWTKDEKPKYLRTVQ